MFHIIIPARLKSTRLPRKMLLDVDGIPLVVMTAQNALKANPASLTIATDSSEIDEVCKKNGFRTILTRENHISGTERLTEAVETLDLNDTDIVVNVQGDEPLIDTNMISEVANLLDENPDYSIATCGSTFKSTEDFLNPNNVKIVLNKFNEAIYFSRAPIPWDREKNSDIYKIANPNINHSLHHIGIYAYRVSYLKGYSSLDSCSLEHMEALEQLRAIYNGHKIKVLRWEGHCHKGIDTQEDLQILRDLISTL
ncbi:3-deoxy-manno-octulosonate cytidylyltransferase [Taylorella equigenitalis]|uniref:3-deoxy-manno-octulosonate cytidylyltransferase n=1 Tax=Taylorella equigenitalis TaxID=29575 RepID=UPI0004246AA4|nr:3-deoxy-manno-octulosonate cytidylyltransferase [Taylorella equigenitalis]ASY37786.1 3-deoxy-manno-octulosonate cytidylyltransferase [Taylorella equigenitalis]KGK32805.1 3-deoxy-manno-octulosonate cytidylyltransferase [Taylorella equigenitalis]WDU47073.1 3-deoxy-manno-octulosonate cytidylyltransferase [Taylorella equigenitalis]